MSAANDPSAGVPRNAEEAISGARQAYMGALNRALRSDYPSSSLGKEVEALAVAYLQCVRELLGPGAVLDGVAARVESDLLRLIEHADRRIGEREEVSRVARGELRFADAPPRVRALYVATFLRAFEQEATGATPRNAFLRAEQIFATYASQPGAMGARMRQLASLARACADQTEGSPPPGVAEVCSGLRELFDTLKEIEDRLIQAMPGGSAP